MAVYVDALKHHGTRKWCHMWADTIDELHAMVDEIGASRKWFQDDPRLPHYDLQWRLRARAIAKGAVVASLKEYMRWKRSHKEDER